MKKLFLTTAIALTLSGCVVGPPNYNERDRRAYNSLQEVDRDHYRDDDGYHYSRNRNWRDRGHDRDHDDDDDDYNPHTGHDRWVKHNN